MPVTDAQVAFLRAYLTGEHEDAEQMRVMLAESGTADGVAELVYAALAVAARREFAAGSSRADIIRFVARVRALLSEEPDALDPVAAEWQLRSALGEKLDRYYDEEAAARAQVILLDALVQNAALDDAAVVGLLTQARELADRLLTQRS